LEISTGKYNFVDYFEIMKEKSDYIDSIEGIQRSGHGKCIHINKIAPGCRGCFNRVGKGYGMTIKLGSKCNLSCPYCFDGQDKSKEVTLLTLKRRLADIYRKSLDAVEFSGFAFSNGEPLLYIDRMAKFGDLFKDIERRKGITLWNKLYTNGTVFTDEIFDKLWHWNFKELRFHPSASNFSDTVYRNMEKANERGFVVAVEEAAYPPNRDKLLNNLKTFQEVGVKHVQLCETKVFEFNIDMIANDFPEGRFYWTNTPFLYHEGLTYDVMKNVIDNNYSFSILDCSSEVWRMNHGIHHQIVMEGIEDVFADYGPASRGIGGSWEKC